MKRLANDPEELPLFRELVDQIFSRLPMALYASILIAGLVVLVLWHSAANTQTLLTWLLVVSVVSLARLVTYYWYHSCVDRYFSPNQWLYVVSAGAILAGISWGAAGLLFYSKESPQTNVFIAFVLGGLVAGAAGTLATMKHTLHLFTALLFLPIIIVFFCSGDNLQMVMGGMMIVYGAAYLVFSASTGRMIITSLRLRHENRREIEVRKMVETELRLVKDELEETVAQRTRQLKIANDELSKEIADRLRAEVRLKSSEERFHNLVESSS